jgi:membrane protease YdiL (CAAX protease family)
VLACAAVLVVAFANAHYFELVNGVIRARETVARGVVFSSWLLLVGAPLAIWRPAAFGFRRGGSAQHWRLIVGTVGVAAVATWALLAVSRSTPYSGASLVIECVVVPFTEELVFRGVLLTVLLVVLSRIHGQRAAAALAIVFDGLAFGLGHLANATVLDVGFVLRQVAFASGLGMACAFLMVRSRSVYPAMLLHAVVNGVVVAS